jgi:hypothetical protein
MIPGSAAALASVLPPIARQKKKPGRMSGQAQQVDQENRQKLMRSVN